jgi:hypothetical protein
VVLPPDQTSAILCAWLNWRERRSDATLPLDFFSRLRPVLQKCWQLTKCWIGRLQRVCETAAAEEPSDGEDVGAMFFLMRYHTIAANRREINLARQFCRVSLVHRMETKVARQPFEVIRLPPAFISSLVVFYLRRFVVARKRNC